MYAYNIGKILLLDKLLIDSALDGSTVDYFV